MLVTAFFPLVGGICFKCLYCLRQIRACRAVPKHQRTFFTLLVSVPINGSDLFYVVVVVPVMETLGLTDDRNSNIFGINC